MNKAYVIAGPARIGNVFGVYGHNVPEGRFVVVEDDEYSNGGHGPSQCGTRRLYDSRAEAQAAADSLNGAPADQADQVGLGQPQVAYRPEPPVAPGRVEG